MLVICDYYLPGFESGGAMRTLVNMIDRLGDKFEFRVVTRDHDGPHNLASYPSVRIGEWNKVGTSEVYYLRKSEANPKNLREIIAAEKPDAIYLNSFFSPLTVFVLGLRKLRLIPHVPVVLAPEGEFSAGAIKLKGAKKQLYVSTAKLLRLLDDIVWKAAAEEERQDMIRVLGDRREIRIAANMPPKTILDRFDLEKKPLKSSGAAKMVFLSRFARKKNFNWLLTHLKDLEGELQIDIWGPIEDEDYWRETQELIRELPPTVVIGSKGPVAHDQVAETLLQYHFFILPTLGENFGHVFIEAFAAGCPVITSDQTPWRQLEEKGIGWDLPFDQPQLWTAAINECITMNEAKYRQMAQQAHDFSVTWLADPSLESDNREVLELALGQQ